MKKYIKDLSISIISFSIIVSSCKKDKNNDLVKDIDGNVYHTVKIGEQTWMVENLKVTHYNDNTPIPKVTEQDAWNSLSTGAYCIYDNAEAEEKDYGKLYNWYAVNTKKLAPKGWHVPTDADWTQLEEYLIANGYNYDGTTTGNKIAKALAAKIDWENYNNEGVIGNDLTQNNKSGFSALPTGWRRDDAYLSGQQHRCYWWSSSNPIPNNAIFRWLSYSEVDISSGNSEPYKGFSVRCIKD